MSHELTLNQNGEYEAFYAVDPAWHGHGQVVDGAKTSREAIVCANMAWHVSKLPTYLKDGTQAPAFVTRREDNKKILGTVGSVYQPLQNIEAFNFIDDLVVEGNLMYESAGSLKGGAVIWLLLNSSGAPTAHEVDAEGRFNQLLPGRYRVVMVQDENGDGRWSGARPAKGLHPEPVLRWASEVDVRAGWEVEIAPEFHPRP